MMVFAHAADGWDGMRHMGDGWGWWMLLALPMAVVWIGVIWALVMLLRRPAERRTDREPSATPRALEILEQRYARGEVSDEEFAAKRRSLTDAPPGPA